MILSNKRILMFEDNIQNIRVQERILKDEGAEICLFLGGSLQEIISLLPIDLIIMDLMFPGNMTGFDFFQKVREVAELSHIPIVAVSAMDASLAVKKTQEMGFSGFISKPVDMDAFPHQITTIINGQSVWNPRR